jgi:hypothetical protein
LTLLWCLPSQFTFLGLQWKKENLILICAVLATTLPAVAISLMQRLGEADRQRIGAFHDRLTKPIGSLPEDVPAAPTVREAGMSPFRVVGICVALIGAMMLVITPWVAEGVQRGLNAGLGGGLLLIGLWMERRSRAAGRRAATAELTTKTEV